MAVTIKDIAERAGVSFSTVSKALRDSPLVRPETKRKILAIAEEMGYRPNIAARRLVSNKSWTIGVAWPSLHRVTLSHLVTRINEVLEEHKYTTLLSINRMDKAIDAFARLQVDAIFLIGDGSETGIQPLLESISIPVLYYGVDGTIPVPTVDVQRGRAVTLAVQHLAGQGHTHIVYVGGVTGHDVLQEQKTEAYETRMRERGLEPRVVVVPKMDSHEGYLAAKELLRQPVRPTALISGSYDITRGILRAAGELGIRIPEELSVVSYDLLPQLDDLEVPVTAVGVHMDAIVDTISRTLLAMIGGEKVPDTLFMEPELFVRASTAPPAGNRH